MYLIMFCLAIQAFVQLLWSNRSTTITHSHWILRFCSVSSIILIQNSSFLLVHHHFKIPFLYQFPPYGTVCLYIFPHPICSRLLLNTYLSCSLVLVVIISLLFGAYLLYIATHFQESLFTGLDYWTHLKWCEIPFQCRREANHVYSAYFSAKFAPLACWGNFTWVSRGQRSCAWLISFNNELGWINMISFSPTLEKEFYTILGGSRSPVQWIVTPPTFQCIRNDEHCMGLVTTKHKTHGAVVWAMILRSVEEALRHGLNGASIS